MTLAALTTLSSLLLTVLTAVYVFFTYRIMRESTQAISANQEAVAQLFRILTAPYLFCQVRTQNDRTTLTVSNSGNAPAYDVDIFALSVYDEQALDTSSFTAQYVRPSDQHYWPLSADDEGFYGVFDRCWYPVFFHRRKVHVELDSPECPDCLYILLQYRDASGTNFSFVYWLFKEVHDAIYRIADMAPAQASPSPRVLFDESHHLVVEGGQSLPEHIDKDFISIWDHSIPSGFLVKSRASVEDRGEWSDI